MKPLDGGELLARVKRSLRRAAQHTNGTDGNGNGNGSRRTEDVGLSPREREILSLLADGRTQGDIVMRNSLISPKTVATHIQHILSKLGVHTRAQAVALAFRRGLVDQDVRAHALVVQQLTASA